MRRGHASTGIRRTGWLSGSFLVLLLLAFAVQLVLSHELRLALVHNAAVVPRWLLGDAPRPAEVAFVPLWLTPLSAVFIQPGIIQFSLNLLWLAIFGPRLERAIGPARLALLLLLCIYASTVFQAFCVRDMNAVVGVSGATGGILGASLILHPKRLLRLRPLPSLSLPLPAIFFLVGWFGLDLVSAVRDVAGAVPLFDKARIWFSLEEWDDDGVPERRFVPAAIVGLYVAVAAAAIARGRF
jgi:membrane associated rhomboid family serine protease